MKFTTYDIVLFQDMIANAIRKGLTFHASDADGMYVITYQGGF